MQDPRLKSRNENWLLVDAGDQFQGSLFYQYYKGDTAAEFMNGMAYDAMAVGNHEFDDGPEALRSALTYEAATGHAYTLIDGADPADLVTVARATNDRALIVGTPALLRALHQESKLGQGIEGAALRHARTISTTSSKQCNML